MSFLGGNLANLHIPTIGGIKKQFSKVMIFFEKNTFILNPLRENEEKKSFYKICTLFPNILGALHPLAEISN